MTMAVEPSTRCYPRDDTEFAGDVRRAVEDAGSDPDLVVTRLRATYPRARIVVRDELANVGDEEAVWYCYRDGSAVGSDDRGRTLG